MSATDELRRLLDERGVDWKAHGHENHTWWSNNEYVGWHAENRHSVRGLYVKIEAVLTPEQAIAATLGRGTCHIEERNGDLYCDGCGEMVGTYDPTSELFIDGNAIELWEFCQRCGAEVIK